MSKNKTNIYKLNWKYVYIITIIAIFLLQSSSIVKFNVQTNVPVIKTVVVKSIYEVAEDVTGTPANILKAVAIIESNEYDNAIGDGGNSKGRMQLNEKYHAERANKYGEYNPFNSQQAVIIAGFIFMEHCNKFNNVNKAIAAYRQGVHGVKSNGPTTWYVNRVTEQIRKLENK